MGMNRWRPLFFITDHWSSISAKNDCVHASLHLEFAIWNDHSLIFTSYTFTATYRIVTSIGIYIGLKLNNRHKSRTHAFCYQFILEETRSKIGKQKTEILSEIMHTLPQTSHILSDTDTHRSMHAICSRCNLVGIFHRVNLVYILRIYGFYSISSSTRAIFKFQILRSMFKFAQRLLIVQHFGQCTWGRGQI